MIPKTTSIYSDVEKRNPTINEEKTDWRIYQLMVMMIAKR